MIKSRFKRVGKHQEILNKPEQRIKNLFNNDIYENVQLRRTQFIQSIHPNPKNLIQQGYVVHSLPLRNCDVQKIYCQTRSKTNATPERQKQDSLLSKSQIKIQRIKTSVQKDKYHNMTIDDNYSIIAQLPAFYPKNKQNNRGDEVMATAQNFAIRIKSLSHVKNNLAESTVSKIRSVSYEKKKKRLSQRKLLLKYQINSNSFLYDNYLN